MPVLYAVKHDREPCHEKWGIKGPPAAVKTFFFCVFFLAFVHMDINICLHSFTLYRPCIFTVAHHCSSYFS